MQSATAARTIQRSISLRSVAAGSGSFQCRITVLGLRPNTRSKSLGCLSVCIPPPITLERGWVWRFVSASCNVLVGGSGLNLNREEVRYFHLHSQPDETVETRPGAKRLSILLVEDNPGDVGLVCEA